MPTDDTSMRLGVEGLGKFKADLQAASNSVRALGSETKLAESEFRKTGDAQAYLQQKTAALTKQIEAQKKAVDAAERGLKEAIAAYGANSAQAQVWSTKLNVAKTSLNNLEASLNSVTNGTDKMLKGTSELSRVANATTFQAYKTALDSVANKLNALGNAAKRIAKDVWSSATDSAAWADNLATNASKYGVSTDVLQQWEYAARFVDVEASTIASASNRLLSSMRSDNEALAGLGVTWRTSAGSLRDTQDVFWDTIDALSRMTDETERDSTAQQVFGKSFAELKPLIDAGRDSWEAYSEEAKRAGLVIGEDQLGKLLSFNDSLDRMSATGQALVNGIFAELAPGFEAIADTATEAAQSILEWTKSEEGQKALKGLADSIQDLIKSLADGGMEKVINGVTGAIQTLGDVAKWASENTGALLAGLVGFEGLKIGGGVLRTANAAKNLFGLGSAAAAGGSAAAGHAAAAGTAAGGAAAGSSLATLATGGLGFVGGIAAVMGVGLLAGALADKDRTADFNLSGNAEYKRIVETNQAREEAQAERRSKQSADTITEQAQAIIAAIEEMGTDTDWRVQQTRSQLAGMTPEDIRKAMESASLTVRTEDGSERPQTQVEADINITVEAIAAMTHDGKVEKHEIEAVKKYVEEHFNPAVESAVGLIQGGWTSVLEAMEYPPSVDLTPDTEREVLTYTAMTKWVEDNMNGDKNTAVEDAKGLWTALMLDAGSPDAAMADLQETADSAQKSGKNKSWNAMVKWIKETMAVDEKTAEAMAKGLWLKLGQYASDQAPELDKEYTGSAQASTVFQSYVEKIFGGDYETAKETLDGWLADLDQTVQGHTPDTTGTGGDGKAAGTGGSTYLTDKVAELTKVRDEIQTICDAIADAVEKGIPIDQAALDRLDYLMQHAEGLGAEVGWYQSEEAVRGRGALGLAMSGQWTPEIGAVATAYVEALREHELAGIQADIDNAKSAEGNAFKDYLEKQGAAEDLKLAYEADGQWTDAEKTAYEAAAAEAEAAKAAYDEAQATARKTEAEADGRREAVEKEYSDNMAEIFAGMAKVLGYEGQGGAQVRPYTVEEAKAGFVPSRQVANMSGYAMGSARLWARPEGYGGELLMERQANMTREQQQMADALYAQYGSFDKFMASLSKENANAMRSILDYGTTSAEGNFWSDIMYNAFGKLPGSTYYGGGVSGVYNPGEEDAWKFMSALLDFKPREDETKVIEEAAKAESDRVNALLEEMAGVWNESTGYDAFKADLKKYADAGTFENVDWTKIDGGITEDVLADLAAEAEAAGEEVGNKYGTGMEKSQSTVFAYSQATGYQVPAGMAAGIKAGEGLVTSAAAELANAANSTVSSTLDIHSPSRVMASLGEYVAQGFAQGIGSKVEEVEAAAYRLSQAVAAPVEASGRRGGGSSATYNNSSALYVDKYYQNSAEDIDYLSRQLADRQQLQLQGYGHGR